MKSLAGTYIKDEEDYIDEAGKKLYAFMLVFPNKRRIYYFETQSEKQRWFETIKELVNYANINEYYDLGEVLGKGKYGVVRHGRHKRT
jgi:hypothetical protein